MAIDDGGPAYPMSGRVVSQMENMPLEIQGMSLRDHFAGLAIAAYGPSITQEFLDHVVRIVDGQDTPGGTSACDSIANIAYAVADAMIAAKRRTEQSAEAGE